MSRPCKVMSKSCISLVLVKQEMSKSCISHSKVSKPIDFVRSQNFQTYGSLVH